MKYWIECANERVSATSLASARKEAERLCNEKKRTAFVYREEDDRIREVGMTEWVHHLDCVKYWNELPELIYFNN